MPLVPSAVAQSQPAATPGQRPPSQETSPTNSNTGHRQPAPPGQPSSRDTIPQYDGAGDEEEEEEEGGDDDETGDEEQGPESKRTRSKGPTAASDPTATNGIVGRTPVPTSLAPATTIPIANGGTEELGSDLDDEEEGDEAVDDENINDLVLCQYEKISRVRTRWRGVLRSGIVHVNNRDYCFSKANMDFEW